MCARKIRGLAADLGLAISSTSFVLRRQFFATPVEGSDGLAAVKEGTIMAEKVCRGPMLVDAGDLKWPARGWPAAKELAEQGGFFKRPSRGKCSCGTRLPWRQIAVQACESLGPRGSRLGRSDLGGIRRVLAAAVPDISAGAQNAKGAGEGDAASVPARETAVGVSQVFQRPTPYFQCAVKRLLSSLVLLAWAACGHVYVFLEWVQPGARPAEPRAAPRRASGTGDGCER